MYWLLAQDEIMNAAIEMARSIYGENPTDEEIHMCLEYFNRGEE
jgi:hypothetical protein